MIAPSPVIAPSIVIAPLGRGDEARADAFLADHADSSMLLRSNLRAAGLVDRGAPLEGSWFGAIDEHGRVTAVASHGWNGMVLVQAPGEALGDLVRAAVERTRDRGRGVAGIIGPLDQVKAARTALGLDTRVAVKDETEDLFVLALDEMVVPSGLTEASVPSQRVRCRRTRTQDLERCTAWRIEYLVEAFGFAREPDLYTRSRHDVEHAHSRGDAFVLEDASGALVAYSAFNAHLPDAVQVGGVWTPPALRTRGYGRAVVAGSLLAAQSEGVRRAVLFTGATNLGARRAYEALGFRADGAFGLVLFARGDEGSMER